MFYSPSFHGARCHWDVLKAFPPPPGMSLKPLTVSLSSRTSVTVDTTVLHAAGSASDGPLLVFLPGNPGFINYYATYLRTIHAAYPELEVLGISHAGFSSIHGPDPYIYTLEDQIEHKIVVIKHYLQHYPHREVLIFGHSVGSYMLQRVVDRLNCQFKLYALVTPTVVDIHRSAKGTVLNFITQWVPQFHHYVGYLTYIVRALPKSMKEALVKLAMRNAISEAKECTKMFISEPDFVRQSLGLGGEEMQTIRSDWQYQELWFRRKGVWAFFAEGDHWVSDETRSQLIKVIKEAHSASTVDISAHFTHSFCVSKSLEFADVTIEHLKRVL